MVAGWVRYRTTYPQSRVAGEEGRGVYDLAAWWAVAETWSVSEVVWCKNSTDRQKDRHASYNTKIQVSVFFFLLLKHDALPFFDLCTPFHSLFAQVSSMQGLKNLRISSTSRPNRTYNRVRREGRAGLSNNLLASTLGHPSKSSAPDTRSLCISVNSMGVAWKVFYGDEPEKLGFRALFRN